MITHIIGFRNPDEKWQKMKGVWDSCLNAGIKIPIEVLDFFDDEIPDNSGIRVSLDKCAYGYTSDTKNGYEVELEQLPENVNRIRFWNEWPIWENYCGTLYKPATDE